MNKLLAWNLLSARTLRLSKTTSNRADHRLCLCQIISDDIMIINIKWVCNHPHWKPQAKPRSVLSVHRRQGKFRLQKDCNGFGFSLLLCRNVHSLEVPLIAPCWQLLLLQLCLRLQAQLSWSVYPSFSPHFHQMHTTFLTDAASKPQHLSPASMHYFSI